MPADLDALLICLYVLVENMLPAFVGKGLAHGFQQIAGDVVYGAPRYFSRTRFNNGISFAGFAAGIDFRYA